jgi:3-deoxy-7-phosphoheptulonate synthase
MMFKVTDDLRIADLRPLIPPAILMEQFPISETASNTVSAAREQTSRIIHGNDDRLLVVVGPCSIHDPKAALDYGGRLKEQAERLDNELAILMRVYFEKPRTTVGWKGLINDPRLDDSFAINEGLQLARSLLLDLGNMGLAVGSEFLDTITPQFIADLISWGAIGARTTESQVHRELASGLSMPVGFKNGTDGNVQIVVDAIGAARNPHHFLSVTKQGISAIVATDGNNSCHPILRGSTVGPNYHDMDIQRLGASLEKAGLGDRIMIDCSHGNSNKDHARQPQVAEELAGMVASGNERICGAMLESHLVGGRQDNESGAELVYGQSITDACISWEETVPILERLAAAVRQRRES